MLNNKTIKKIVLAMALTSAPFTAAASNVVDWSSEEGMVRLSESQHKNDFFKLANFYTAQQNKAFCGPASASMVLNALRVRETDEELPLDQNATITPSDSKRFDQLGFTPFYNKYTQTNVLDNSSKTAAQVLGEPAVKGGKAAFGLTLAELSGVLKSHDLSVTTVYMDDDATIKGAKAELIKVLGDKTDFVLANYSRKTLGQPGGGHISPIAAYHKASDSFLVMDVTNTKAAWVWVDSDTLFDAMATMDGDKSRGYVLARERTNL